jgi:hypothetical protein
MTKIGEVSVRKRRSRHEIKRLVAEFETSGLRRGEFCQKYNLALGTLQRGLRRRRMEVDGQSEAKRLVEVKLSGIQRNGSGPGSCPMRKSHVADRADVDVRHVSQVFGHGIGISGHVAVRIVVAANLVPVAHSLRKQHPQAQFGH